MLSNKVIAAFIAAVTSPSAVAQERSLAVFIVTRVLLASGASYGIVELVAKIVGG